MTILLVSPARAELAAGRGDRDRRGGGERLDLRVVEDAATSGEGRRGDRLERRLAGDGDRWR